MKFSKKNTFNVGDLCTVSGYGKRIWRVNDFSYEGEYKDKIYKEAVLYTLFCISSSEKKFGYEEDLMLICRRENVVEYFKQKNPKAERFDPMGAEPYEYPDTSDGLLDRLVDLLTIAETLGTNNAVQKEIEEIKKKLSLTPHKDVIKD